MADALPDLQFDDDLPELDFGDGATTGTLPDLEFDDTPELQFDDADTTVADASGLGVLKDYAGKAVDAVIDNPATRWMAGKQQEALNDPERAGIAGAILSPLAVLGVGDTPIAESEYENRAKAAREGIDYKPSLPVDPLVAEKVGGAVGRVLLSGGAAPIAEGVAKGVDIAQHEPEEDLTDLSNVGRIGLASAMTYIPMKAGAAVEGAVANMGLGKLATFGANAGADLAIGTGAGMAQNIGEKALTGQEITSEDFIPSKMDVALGLPGTVAAGMGGVRASAARKVPETGSMAKIGASPSAEPLPDLEFDTAPIKEGYESGTLERPQDPAQVENEARSLALQAKVSGEPQIAKAINDALEGKPTSPEQRQMLRGLGISPLSLRNRSLTKGASNGLQQREVQGETTGRPVNTESQEIAATPEPQAGMGVINLAGDQGAPTLGLGALSATRGAVTVPTQPKARPLATDTTTPIPKIPEAMRKIGAEAIKGRTDEGVTDPKRIGGINLFRFAGDDAAKQELIAGAMLSNEERVNAQRFIEGGALERAAKIDKWANIEDVEKLKPNEVLNDENATSLDNYTLGAVDEFMENPSIENTGKALTYLTASAGVGSAQARALSARREFREAWMSKLPAADRGLINVRDMFHSADKPIPQSAIERFAKIGKENRNNPEAVMEAIVDIHRKHKGALGQLSAYRFANMLSSPLTHGLNAASNATMIGAEAIIRPVMKGLDVAAPGESVMAPGENRAALKALGKGTGPDTVGLAGAFAGLADAGSKAKYVFMKGFRKSDLKDLDPENLIADMPGGLKNPLNYPSRSLFAADEFFKTLGDAMTRSAMAHRKGYNEAVKKGLKGDEIADYLAYHRERLMWGDKEVDDTAKEMGKWFTQQEPTWLNKLTVPKSVPEPIRNSIEFVISNIQPFHNAILNVGKKGLMTQGLGVGAPLMGKHLTRDQKLRNAAMGTVGLATTVSLLPYLWAGKITGAVPDDAQEREKFYESKKIPYAVQIGDRWIDYRNLGPYGQPLMTLAAISDAIRTKKQKPESSVIANSALGVLRAFTSLPVLSGVSGLMDALNDPDGKGQSFLANVASQYVPLSSAQRFANKSGLAGEGVADAATIRDRVVAGTVFDYTLPPKVNTFGKPIKRGGIYPRVDSADPVYAELDRLSLNPPGRTTSANVGGETRALKPDERRQLQMSVAPAYDEAVALVNSPEYKAMGDEDKKRELELVLKNTVRREKGFGLRRLRLGE